MDRPDRPRRHAEFYRTPLGRRVLELEVELLLDHLPHGGTVLSVGCGICAHEAWLSTRRPGLRVVGLDVDAGMLALAPRHIPRVRGDAAALPFGDGSLDAAIFVTSLEFTEDPVLALGEASRVVRHGGTLVVLALDPDASWGRDRLGEREVPWKGSQDLVAMVADASTGTAVLDRADGIDGEEAGPTAPPGETVLLVVSSDVKSNKSLGQRTHGP